MTSYCPINAACVDTKTAASRPTFRGSALKFILCLKIWKQKAKRFKAAGLILTTRCQHALYHFQSEILEVIIIIIILSNNHIVDLN